MLNREKIVSQVLTGLVGAVITIVAVALVALVPLRAQQNARSAATSCEDNACTCQDNLKQLGIAMIQYYQDYDEKFPSGTQDSSASSMTGVGWAGQLYGYAHLYQYQCPSDRTMATKPEYVVSYGCNTNIAGLSLAAFTEPSSTILLFEMSGTPVLVSGLEEGNYSGATTFSSTANGTDGSLLAGRNATVLPSVTYATGILAGRPRLASGSQFPTRKGRHYGYGNYLMANGSVHYYSPGDVSSGTNANTATDPQTGTTTGAAAGTYNGQFQATFSAI